MKAEDGNRMRKRKTTSELAGTEKKQSALRAKRGEGFLLLEQCLLSGIATQINTTVIYTSIHNSILY